MTKRILLHIGFWVVFLLFRGYIAVAFLHYSYWDLPWIQQLWKGFGGELILLPVKMGVAYSIMYFLVPSFVAARQIFKTGILALLILMVAMFVHRYLTEHVIYPYIYETAYSTLALSTLPARLLYSFFDIAAIAGIATAIKFIRLRLSSVTREKQLMEEKLQSELNFLRTQTNPHFLFNTLNNIYAMARKGAPQTAEVVMKLSKLLRFMIYDCTAPRIALIDEVRMIENYIELEKLRYNSRLKVMFDVNADHESQPIAPLLLLPLVENAFKHGASETRRDAIINIKLLLQKRQLHFHVSNVVEEAQSNENRGGIGQSNVRRQLELIYPGHKLEIQRTDNTYFVDLQIHFPEDENFDLPGSGR